MFNALTLLAVDCDKSGGFLGLWPWWHYLPSSDFSGCNIVQFNLIHGASDVPLVLLAVIDDLLRVGGLVAVGFTIYGAIQYIISQGSPEQTSKAQSTIINAVAGLAIAIVATAFVSFLGNKLGN
jgi:hypothetical protein